MQFSKRLFVTVALTCLLLGAAYLVAAQEGGFDPAMFMPTEAELAATPPDPNSDDPVERGAYLVRVQMACVGCHGTFNPEGPLPGVIPLTSELAGGEEFAIPDVFTVYAANLTQLGEWSDEAIENAIRFGIRPDGTGLAPIMGFQLYRNITAQDMSDIIAYLRSLEPVENDIPEPAFALPVLSRESLGQMYAMTADMDAEAPEPDFTDPVQRGVYLANVSHCMSCHGQVDMQTFAFTPAPDGLPWGDLVGASLMPFAMSGYTDEQIVAVLETGMKANGEMALGMPWPSYQHMPESDQLALVAWMRSLPDIALEDRPMPAPMGGAPEPQPAPETTPGS